MAAGGVGLFVLLCAAGSVGRRAADGRRSGGRAGRPLSGVSWAWPWPRQARGAAGPVGSGWFLSAVNPRRDPSSTADLRPAHPAARQWSPDAAHRVAAAAAAVMAVCHRWLTDGLAGKRC